MKRDTILFLFSVLILLSGLSLIINAQSPEKFSYQAVIRDNFNQLVLNQPIGMRISIVQGSASGASVYMETHTPVSNANGLISIEVGAGVVVTGSFSAIDWTAGPYFIQTEADPSGGTNYNIAGVSQLISVPYALHANTANTVTGVIPETDPVFGASTAAGITGADTASWNAKLDMESDPVFNSWDKSTGITITESQITNLQPYLLAESDPAFNASVAAAITGADTTAWHAKLDAETDPAFNSWDKSTGITIIESQITNLQPYLLTESDPAFNASVAAGITGSDTAVWNQKLDYYTETQELADVLLLGNDANALQIKNLADPTNNQDAATKMYVDNKAITDGTAIGELLFWNGIEWVAVAPGTHGQTLTFCNGVPTWGPCSSVPNQPPLINGSTSPCENETGLIYNVTQEAGVTYTWAVPTGWSITAGQSTYEITVAAGTTSGGIDVTPSNAAGNGPSRTLAVTTQVCSTAYPPGTVHCALANPTAVVDVTNPTTGKTWMDRNLGAAQVATSSADSLAFGDLYQWGRGADGHQCRNSAITLILSSNDQPGHGDFILTSGGSTDWRSPENINLWQGLNGNNNPCPSGYRVPTETELNEELLSWSNPDSTGAIGSPLKLLLAGRRASAIQGAGSRGDYWTATTNGTSSRSLFFSAGALINTNIRALGLSVRCIKETGTPLQGSINSLDCNSGTNTGTLTIGVAASGASSSIPYTGGNGGTYSVQTVSSTGVTGLTATLTAGSFANGNGSVTYTISGSPATIGTAHFALILGGQSCVFTFPVDTNGTTTPPGYPLNHVHCNPVNPTPIVDIASPITNKIWMDRNLGASQVATSSTDATAYGDLFQWGRRADGHQCRNSLTTSALSSTDQPAHGDFILSINTLQDWRSPQNTSLWQGVNGVNNPCPSGYRLPTETEFNAERLSWSSADEAGAFNSPLKLTKAGYRANGNGVLANVGGVGLYWSSTVSSTDSRFLYFNNSSAFMIPYARSRGLSVRCLKDNATPVQGSINSLGCNTATNIGALTTGFVASGVSSIIPYTGGNGGIYIGQTVNSTGVTGLTATLTAGSFANGSGNLTYIISGTPATSGTANFALNIGGQSCVLTRSVGAPVVSPNYPSGYVHCNPSNPTAVVDVTNPATNKIWMDRNLGALQVATSSTDANAYGDLYQWGRGADGHQCRTSPTTSTLSSVDQPGHGNFILATSDWRQPHNDNLWQGLNGINNPCPSGYRLPTEAEFDAELLSWNANNAAGAFSSPLKLVMAGQRLQSNGSLIAVGTGGIYWSSSVVYGGLYTVFIGFDSNSSWTYADDTRSIGYSVRCIKN